MALTVVLWLASGATLAAFAWRAAADAFPAGPLSCFIAGLGGAFVGGALFVLLGGPAHSNPDSLTLLGSTAGSLLCLGLTTRAAGGASPGPRTRSGDVWLQVQLWSPIMFAVAVGGAFARANDSPLVGSAAASAVVAFIVFWHHYRPRLRRSP